MGFFSKRSKAASDNASAIALAAVIQDTVSSEIYRDILKENGIPCICRQDGAGGYIKLLTGGLLAPDSIYVNERDLERARELYEVYLKTEVTFVEDEVE